MTVALPLSGGCHCGALRYELTAAPIFIAACHCTNCQKFSGSAFAVNAMVREDALKCTKGAPKTTEWVSDSGNQRFGWFCGDCGSRIAHGQTPSAGVLSLRTGAFDDVSWVRPVGHIWVKSAQSWVKFDKDELLCDEQPTDYGPYIERFRGLGLFSA